MQVPHKAIKDNHTLAPPGLGGDKGRPETHNAFQCKACLVVTEQK